MADGTADVHEAAVSERDENATTSVDESEDEEHESEEESDEEDEPKLKYARMTPNLSAVYRNGDATSTFLVTGDKMVYVPSNGRELKLIIVVHWNTQWQHCK